MEVLLACRAVLAELYSLNGTGCDLNIFKLNACTASLVCLACTYEYIYVYCNMDLLYVYICAHCVSINPKLVRILTVSASFDCHMASFCRKGAAATDFQCRMATEVYVRLGPNNQLAVWS